MFALAVPRAHAEERYIIPVTTIPSGPHDPFWFSHVTISNPHPFPVVYRTVAMYPYGADTYRCYSQAEVTLKAYQTSGVDANCFKGMMAIVITSESPLALVGRVSYFRWMARPYAEEVIREQMAIGREWLSPNDEHVIPQVAASPYGEVRSNLFLVNPGDTDLHVDYERTSDGPMPIHHVTVPPHSSQIVSLPADQTTCFNGGDVASLYCATPLKLKADGAFYATVSVIDGQFAEFRTAAN
jgi:hypothetical protein